MNISRPFIDRPVMTTLVMVGILFFGIMGYLQLPISDLPNVDYPNISVTANLPGANPETMAAAVATPLEKQFSTIAGIDSMTSTSGQGTTNINVTFTLSRSIDAAALDVQSAITAALKQLPPGMPTPPSFQKVNPGDQPILYLALNSDTLPMSQVDEYAETMMAQRISMVSGVAQVQVYGTQKYAVRVQLDPSELAAHDVTYDDVNQALQNANVNLPTGILYGHHQAFTVEANGQLMNAGEYMQMIIAYRNGAPIRLNQVGRAIDGIQNDKNAGWYKPEGRPEVRSVVLAIQRQPGTNTVKIVDDVKALLPKFRARLPASVNLDEIYDRSQTIRASVSDVNHTMLLTVSLVILVIFAFLRSPSATIIPSLSLPMSLIGTYAVMYLLGYNRDNLSLMALTLSAGFVVDDAIVVLENIVRHIESGETVDQAARRGSEQIGFTVLSMTISLTAVFIPVIFMGGIMGRLFREFAVTIAVSILISGFISLTLTPMLCHRFLQAHHKGQRHGLLFRASEAVFNGMFSAYRASLAAVMRFRLPVLLTAVAMLGVSAYLYYIVPKGFVPNEDTERLIGFTIAAQDVSFQEMVKHQREAAAVVGLNPNVAVYFSAAPAGPTQSSNGGIIFCRLVDKAQRKGVTPEMVIAQLHTALREVPGIVVNWQNPATINAGGRFTPGQFQYTLQGTEVEELYAHAPLIEQKIRDIPGVVDVSSDLQMHSPRLVVSIDRDKAGRLGITPGQIENTLAEAYGSQQVSTIYTDVNEYWVILESLPDSQLGPEDLKGIYLRAGNVISPSVQTGLGGAATNLIPMSTLVSVSRRIAPLTISHQGQLPAVTISFNLKEGVAIGDVVKQVQLIELPEDISGSFQGNAQAFQSSTKGLGVLLLVAIAVIYLVLGILYESFIHPITILSGLPAAGIGALLTLMLVHVDLNVYAFIGIIMLIGIVKKNAIMMVDFALQNQKEGLTAEQAILQGCLVRFRPIMMTTMAALMGTLPIALGWGGSSNSRRDLGLVVVGGLLFSQFITLYITPVVYIYLDHLQSFLGRTFARATGSSHRPGDHAGDASGHGALALHPAARSASGPDVEPTLTGT